MNAIDIPDLPETYILNPLTKRVNRAIIVSERVHSLVVIASDDRFSTVDYICVSRRNVRTVHDYNVQAMMDSVEAVLS